MEVIRKENMGMERNHSREGEKGCECRRVKRKEMEIEKNGMEKKGLWKDNDGESEVKRLEGNRILRKGRDRMGRDDVGWEVTALAPVQSRDQPEDGGRGRRDHWRY